MYTLTNPTRNLTVTEKYFLDAIRTRARLLVHEGVDCVIFDSEGRIMPAQYIARAAWHLSKVYGEPANDLRMLYDHLTNA